MSNLSNESLQRESDRERGIFDARRSDRSRFGTCELSDILFTMGMESMNAFRAPELQPNDPKRLAQIAEEVRSEGRQHGLVRPNRNGE